MTVGGWVWLAIGLAAVAWSVVSGLSRQLPGPVAVLRWFCQCWLGRVVALCAWAGAGWHLFCQRP